MSEVILISSKKSIAMREMEDVIRITESKISYYTIRQDTFDPIVLEMEGEEIAPLSITLCATSLDIAVSGKRNILNTAFGILRKHGFTPDKRPEAGSPAYSSWFANDAGARIWFSFTSSQCRRVQIGTRTVEQPIYDTLCDDEGE